MNSTKKDSKTIYQFNILLLTVFLLFFSKNETVAQYNPRQTIRGVIKDELTKQVVPGASIIVLGTSSFSISNESGLFIIENIPVGRYSICISILGYYPVVINELLVSSGKEIVLEIELQERPFKLEEAIIKPKISKDKSQNEMSAVSSRTFSVEEANRFAGTINDPGRMASNYAGVVAAGISNNAIIIRGNAPKGILWRLEGLEIPMPNHFSESNVAGGGGLTIFSGQIMSNLDFYTGAFPAEYSNALSGIFDIKFRNGNNAQKEMAVQVGIQGVELSAEGPFKNYSLSS